MHGNYSENLHISLVHHPFSILHNIFKTKKKVRYRVTHKEWDHRDDYTELKLSVYLYLWCLNTINLFIFFAKSSNNKQKSMFKAVDLI